MEEVNKIRLEFDLHEYKRLAMIIQDHRNLLYKLKLNEAIKCGLIKDMNIIRSIFEKAEIKPQKEEVRK